MIEFFRRLYPLLDRPTKQRLALATAAMLFLAVLEAAALVALVPLMQILTAPNLHSSSSFVSTVSGLVGNPQPLQLAAYLGIVVFGIYIVKSVAAIFIMRWTTTFALAQEAKMVHRLMSVYLEAPYRAHLQRNSAEFVRTLTASFQQIFRVAFVQVFNAVGDLFSVFFVGIILAVANPTLAAVTGIYFAVVSIGYQRTTRRMIARAARKIHEDQATDFRTIQQSLAAVKEVKVRGAEDYFAEDVYRLRSGLVPAYRTMALANVTPRYVLELAMVGAAALISFGAFQTQSVTTATATIGVFVAGGFRILAPLNKVIFGIHLARGAIPSLDQVREDLETFEQQSPVPEDNFVHLEDRQLQPNIAVRDVTFAYVPGVPVLSRITLDIEPGEAVGLVGGSGAGKSTFVDILLGLLEPESGDVLIQGWPIGQVRRQWQQMIGYVPQSIVLFDDTVRANVAFGVPRDEVDDDQVWNALATAQLDDVVHSLTEDLDNIIGEGGVQLSGGQRQRMGVARALYQDPKVLMFDEATSALDNETEFKLTEVLDGLRGRLTTITIAHRLSTVRRCDRLFYLEQGRMLAQGTFAELNVAIPGFARMVELAAVDV
ncbi:MAG TPA: ABC transporter ATP-binding protein [Acidimicrobiia bacterium]